ncbi:hypothetical protein D3C85_1569340 [compost metagenome]
MGLPRFAGRQHLESADWNATCNDCRVGTCSPKCGIDKVQGGFGTGHAKPLNGVQSGGDRALEFDLIRGG